MNTARNNTAAVNASPADNDNLTPYKQAEYEGRAAQVVTACLDAR